MDDDSMDEFTPDKAISYIKELCDQEFYLNVKGTYVSSYHLGPTLFGYGPVYVTGKDRTGKIPIYLRIDDMSRVAMVITYTDEFEPHHLPYELAFDRIAEKLNDRWMPDGTDVDEATKNFIEWDKKPRPPGLVASLRSLDLATIKTISNALLSFRLQMLGQPPPAKASGLSLAYPAAAA